MAVKDKLVTLEDLKAAYDKLREEMGVWEDITDSLTWVSHTMSSGEYISAYPSGRIANPYSSLAYKTASISLSKGEKLKITAGSVTQGIAQMGGYLLMFASIIIDGNASSSSACGGIEPMLFNSSPYQNLIYGSCEFCAPYAGTYTIYDYSGVGNIVVEKQVTA